MVPHRRRLGAAPLLNAAVLLLAGGCAEEPATTGASTTPTTPVAGSSIDASPDADHEAAVRVFQVTVEDPALGPLTFTGLQAGDPGAASRGDLVLLLHGFPETSESFRDLLPGLAAAGYYAVAVDQRGYSPGARPPEVERYGIVELAGDAQRIVDALGAPSYHVVGHDWGGGVAWLLAGLDADRVTSLTALATPHPDAISEAFDDPDHPQHRATAYMETLRRPGVEQELLVSGRDSFIALFGAGGIRADRVERYADVLATPEALGAALNWYRANPLPAPVRMGPVAVPVLYIWGALDGAFPRATAEATASHVTGPYRFVALEEHGHWLPEDAPGEILPLLLEHLRA